MPLPEQLRHTLTFHAHTLNSSPCRHSFLKKPSWLSPRHNQYNFFEEPYKFHAWGYCTKYQSTSSVCSFCWKPLHSPWRCRPHQSPLDTRTYQETTLLLFVCLNQERYWLKLWMREFELTFLNFALSSLLLKPRQPITMDVEKILLLVALVCHTFGHISSYFGMSTHFFEHKEIETWILILEHKKLCFFCFLFFK